MDWQEVPDLEFRILEINGGSYRVPIIMKDTLMWSLSNWQPIGKSRPMDPKLLELDEPLFNGCGIDNPFAGIIDEPE